MSPSPTNPLPEEDLNNILQGVALYHSQQAGVTNIDANTVILLSIPRGAHLLQYLCANTIKDRLYALHTSIMNDKLTLGTEQDQAFNYGRIHHWIDAEIAQANQTGDGET